MRGGGSLVYGLRNVLKRGMLGKAAYVNKRNQIDIKSTMSFRDVLYVPKNGQ